MKKFKNRLFGLMVLAELVILCTLALIAPSAKASFGFDVPGTVRLLTFGSKLDAPGALSMLVTNGPIDKVKFSENGLIILNCSTNVPGLTVTATVYTSPDTTNLTALANYALVTSPTTDTISNYLYAAGGTNALAVSNNVFYPAQTFPNAATAGYATPANGVLQYTNSGAITVTPNTPAIVGINLTDANRYLYVVWNTAGGTTTNAMFNPFLVATPTISPP